MAKHGKSYAEARSRGRPRARVRARRGRQARQGAQEREVRRVGRGPHPHGLNVRHADEQLRGTIALPNGLGKEVKIAVFAQGDKAREAEEAGADVVGAEDLAKRVEEGFTDFDVAIATPDMMPVVGRLGRVLGPQGKMPNPKVGTVTMDVAQGRRGVQGRQGRVPHGPHRDRPPGHRQDELRGRSAAGELRRRSSRRSSARSRRPPRAATSAPSRWPRPWAPASRSTRPAPATSSRRPRRRRVARTDRSSRPPETPGAPLERGEKSGTGGALNREQKAAVDRRDRRRRSRSRRRSSPSTTAASPSPRPRSCARACATRTPPSGSSRTR